MASTSSAMRSKRRRSATSTLAPESSRPYSTSSVFHQPLSPTRIAPRSTVPQKARHHSGLFADSTATRSPCTTPKRLASACDTELARRTNSGKP